MTVIRTGTLGLASASSDKFMISSGQSGSFDLNCCACLKGLGTCSHLFLSALYRHLEDDCLAGHFAHCGSLHPGNGDIFYRIVRRVDLSILIMPHQHAFCTGISNCIVSWSSDQRFVLSASCKEAKEVLPQIGMFRHKHCWNMKRAYA